MFGVLTAIFLLIGLHYYGFGLLSEKPATVNIISNVVSPDGIYAATTNRASNERGWCEERTNIHKKDAAYDWEREYVLSIDCGSEVEMKWKDDKNLSIIYSYGNDEAVNTSQQFLSKDKAVNVSYFLKQ